MRLPRRAVTSNSARSLSRACCIASKLSPLRRVDTGLLGLRLRFGSGHRHGLRQGKRRLRFRDRFRPERIGRRKRDFVVLEVEIHFGKLGERFRGFFLHRCGFWKWRGSRHLGNGLLRDSGLHGRFGRGSVEDVRPTSILRREMGRHPVARGQIAVHRRERVPVFGWARRRPPRIAQERVQQLGVSNAQRGVRAFLQTQEVDEPHRIHATRPIPRRLPFDLREVRRHKRDLAGRDEIQEGGPWEQGRIQPERLVCDQVVDARRTQEIATHGAASNAPRGEHVRRRERGPYKILGGKRWTDDRRGRWARRADIFIG